MTEQINIIKEGRLSDTIEVQIIHPNKFSDIYPSLLVDRPENIPVCTNMFRGIRDIIENRENEELVSTPDNPVVLYEDDASFCTLAAAIHPDVCLVEHKPLIAFAEIMDEFVERVKELMTPNEFDLVVSGTNEGVNGYNPFSDRDDLTQFLSDKMGVAKERTLSIYLDQPLFHESEAEVSSNYIHGLVLIPSQLSNDGKVKLIFLVRNSLEIKNDKDYRQRMRIILFPPNT